MKTVLVFKIPEEQEELEIAQNGGNYYSCLDEIHRYCRSELKHNGKLNKQTAAALEHILGIITEAKL